MIVAEFEIYEHLFKNERKGCPLETLNSGAEQERLYCVLYRQFHFIKGFLMLKEHHFQFGTF